MHTNAGVILMNVTSFREIEAEFTDYVLKNIVDNKPGAQSFNDQTAFHSFFPIRLHHLSVFQMVHLGLFHSTYFKSLFAKYYSDTLPKIYEWEPYLGVNPEAVIVHWHGPKVFMNDCGQLHQHVVTTHKATSTNHPTNSTIHHDYHTHTTNTTIPNVTANIRNTHMPAMITIGANRSMFADPWQIVLQQLVLYNRTYPYSMHYHSRISQRSNRRLRSSHGKSFDVGNSDYSKYSAIFTNSAHNQHNKSNNSLYYPAVYDWYPPMALNEADTQSIQQLAKQSMFYLQTLTPHSLEGYHHATSLFFAYANMICSSSS